MQHLRSFFSNENGATAIEYALIVALIFLAVFTTIITMSGELTSTYEFVGDAISNR
jgi:pilus assembly protein Flp/PilA